MAIWPEQIQPASCTFGRSRNDRIAESPVSRKRQIIRLGRPKWTAQIEWRLRPHQVSEARYQMEAAHVEEKAIWLRDYASPFVRSTRTILAKGAAAIGDTSFLTSGWTPSETGAMLVGQYITISDSLYTITGNVTADGSGEATISLRTPLIKAHATGARVHIVSVGTWFKPTSRSWAGQRRATEGLWSLSTDWVEAGSGGQQDAGYATPTPEEFVEEFE